MQQESDEHQRKDDHLGTQCIINNFGDLMEQCVCQSESNFEFICNPQEPNAERKSSVTWGKHLMEAGDAEESFSIPNVRK